MTRYLLACLVAAALPCPWIAPSAALAQAGPALAPQVARPVAGPAMLAPRPFPPLSAEHEQYLDRILTAWERHSAAIECYRSTFQRWEYDSVFGPKDTFKTYSEGVIQYAKPDKGMFRIDSTRKYVAPKEPGGTHSHEPLGDAARQHWICDGKSVYELNYTQKVMIQRQLPPEMRGKAIADGPLPFLFGAEAAKIKARYWLRVVTPSGVEDEFHLEAWPKTQADAANFRFVMVTIDRKEFLPSGLMVFDVAYRPGVNESRTSFRFSDREVNAKDILAKINIFHREFYEPKLLPGWKKIEDKYDAPEIPPQRVAAPQYGPARANTTPQPPPTRR